MIPTTDRPPILVVDDEPRILDSIRDLLDENFEVIATTDASEALHLLRDSAFVAILVDQRMPGLTGDQFLSRAQGLSDAARILITGYADISAVIRAVNDGQIFTYVSKPWEPAELRGTVLKAAAHTRKLLQRKEAEELVAKQQEELAQSEAAFRQQTKLLKSILDSMGDGVVVTDESGKTLLLNPAARHMLGPRKEMPQDQWSSTYGLYAPATKAPYPPDELPIARALRGEIVESQELYICNDCRPEGAFISVSGQPLKDDNGNTIGGVAVVRDITGAKRSRDLLRIAKEEAERANHAKSEYLSRMSHELRTPLNSILGFAQLLELDALSPNQRDSVAYIMKGGQHLLSLINEVLDLARIEAGRLSLSPESVQVNDVIEDALAFIRPIAQQSNIEIRFERPSEEVHVKADQQRLRQVLLNLLSNAVKYNIAGGQVQLWCELREEAILRICIRDTGHGITEKEQERLFQPFERMGDKTMGIEGTGLGLALSRGLMEAMEGRVGVESEIGRGSTFWIELQAADRPSDAFVIPLEKPNAHQPNAYLQSRTVLYIEDNQANFKLMERIVSHRSELHLIGADRGQLGLEAARMHLPDLILMDLHLPDISGREVLQQLVSDEKTSGIPVVVVSADATPGQIDRLRAAGALSYLTKPLDVASMLRLFDSVFTEPAPATHSVS
jgi:PAS domain S-box-containing protein